MTDELAPAYSGYSLLDNLDALDEALQDGAEDTLPFAKIKSGHLHRFRVLPPSPAWAEFFEKRRRRPIPFFFLWKHLYKDTRDKWISYNCPRRNPGEKRDCLDCERAFAMLNQAETKDDKDAAKTYMAKRKVAMMVIDREDEEAGPKILELSAPFTDDPKKLEGMPLTQWQKLQEVFQVYKKDIVDPSEAGWDFTMLKRGTGQEGTSYEFRAADSASPLSQDPAQIKAWIEGQFNIPELLTIPSNEEIRRKLRLPPGEMSIEQLDPTRMLPAGPAQETAGDIIDAECSGVEDEW